VLSFSVLALVLSAQGHPAHGFRPPTGRLLVVGGPGGIADIQTAVDEAYDGDAILVKPGTYAGLVVSDKSISIVADAGPISEIHGPVTIENLSAGKSALLAGFSVGTMGDAPPLTARYDQGAVRVEECTLGAASYPYSSYDQPAIVLDHAVDVAMIACTLDGGRGSRDGSENGLPGQPALQVLSSSVALRECVLRGGPGGDGGTQSYEDGSGGPGGDGLFVAGGFAYASGSEIRAGDGGAGGDNYNCIGGGDPGDGGAGGSAVRVTSSVNPPDVVHLGSLLVGGLGGRGGIDHTADNGGYACFGDGLPGADGPAVSAPGGAVQSLTGVPRQMTAPRISREGDVVTAHCNGRMGDVVQIYASVAAGFDYVPSFNGVQLISLSKAVVVASGTIPAGGALDLQVPVGSVPKDSKTIFLQAYFRDTSNQRYAATQSTVLAVDPRY
jgi:hypothetical protein